MAEYQCCDFGAPYEPPITESPENDLKYRPSMPSGYIPCNYCQFYASEMCQGCSYFSACVGSITGDSIGGGLTEKEAIAYADSIYDEWDILEKLRNLRVNLLFGPVTSVTDIGFSVLKGEVDKGDWAAFRARYGIRAFGFINMVVKTGQAPKYAHPV